MATKSHKAWLKVFLYFLFLIGLSSIPGEALASFPQFTYMDKFVHLALYTALGFLLEGVPIHFVLLLLLGAAVGGLDEFYQHWIPGRSSNVYDWVMDAVGVALGLWVAKRFFRTYCEKHSRTTSH